MFQVDADAKLIDNRAIEPHPNSYSAELGPLNTSAQMRNFAVTEGCFILYLASLTLVVSSSVYPTSRVHKTGYKTLTFNVAKWGKEELFSSSLNRTTGVDDISVIS